MSGSSRIKNIAAAFCVVAMVAALFIGGALPFAVGLFRAPWDKLAHGLFFFVLVIVLRLSLRLPIWLLTGAAIFVGAADEIHQIWLPGRSASFGDWGADCSGVNLAVVLIRLWGGRAIDPVNESPRCKQRGICNLS